MPTTPDEWFKPGHDACPDKDDEMERADVHLLQLPNAGCPNGCGSTSRGSYGPRRSSVSKFPQGPFSLSFAQAPNDHQSSTIMCEEDGNQVGQA